MTRFLPIIGLLVLGCASETVAVTVDWRALDRAGCTALASGLNGACMEGPDNRANTYIVEVYRHPERPLGASTLRCTFCINNPECELVSTACRCGTGSETIAGHVENLQGLVLGDLTPERDYCLRVVTLYVGGNDPMDGSSACPETFACEGALTNPSILEAGVRTCSLSQWFNFDPDGLDDANDAVVSHHNCRDDVSPRPDVATRCLGLDHFLCE